MGEVLALRGEKIDGSSSVDWLRGSRKYLHQNGSAIAIATLSLSVMSQVWYADDVFIAVESKSGHGAPAL